MSCEVSHMHSVLNPVRLISALLWMLPLSLWAQGAPNEMTNGDFELGTTDRLEGWEPVRRGYEIDRQTFHAGTQSIKCTARGGEDGMGVVQTITYDKPDRRPLIISGWCKTQDTLGGGDCAIYVDGVYEDGSPWWGKRTTWARGTHDWQYSAAVHWPAKPVKELQVFVFLRRTTGTAWFDDIALFRRGLHVTDVQVASDFPRSPNGLSLSATLSKDAAWTCKLLDAKRQSLGSTAGTGRDLFWLWPGGEKGVPVVAAISATAAGGEKVDFPLAIPPHHQPENSVREGYAAWTQDSMTKVYPTAAPGMGRSGALDLARGEHEGLQIAIKPADDAPLTGVKLDVGTLVNESGEAFPRDALRWHVVGYVWVRQPSGHPAGPAHPNWCPDVLLPARPVDVPGGRTQTFWLDAFAERRTAPGTYRGVVTIRPGNAPKTDIPISIRVRSFALPKIFSMRTAFAIMDGFTRGTYGELTPELRRKCLDIMLDHRLNPDDISRTEPPRIEDLLYARERGMNTFNILNLVPRPKEQRLWTCYSALSAYGPDFNQRLGERLDPVVAQLRKHGLARMGYVYGFDERREEYDDLIKGICRFVKGRYPEISTFTTAGYMYSKREETPPDYEDYMDWYCPLSPRYKADLSSALRAKGKQIWWYVCCGPKHPYANFASMDYATIEGRLLPWMTYAERVDGLLFWHVNYWHRNKVIQGDDPYLGDWTSPCVQRMTGDGVLVYPTPTGPVSSIRLENVRDGVEDYDYLSMLTRLKGRETTEEQARQLVRSVTDYSRDPAELYRARSALADEIEAALREQ